MDGSGGPRAKGAALLACRHGIMSPKTWSIFTSWGVHDIFTSYIRNLIGV
jgi:hypothetical protein